MSVTDDSDDSSKDRKVPELSSNEKEIAGNYRFDDASSKEAQLFNSGASAKQIKKNSEEKEADRAEKFRDHFENISIVSMWMLFVLFACLTLVWASMLIIPKNSILHFLDDNEEDKLQIIITSGFAAGIASSHVKKRLGS